MVVVVGAALLLLLVVVLVVVYLQKLLLAPRAGLHWAARSGCRFREHMVRADHDQMWRLNGVL